MLGLYTIRTAGDNLGLNSLKQAGAVLHQLIGNGQEYAPTIHRFFSKEKPEIVLYLSIFKKH